MHILEFIFFRAASFYARFRYKSLNARGRGFLLQLPTTAGMQEVEQRRSSCRRLQGCRR